MQNRVIIVHGWDGNPEEGWFPWLKRELESRGCEVIVPQLPFPEEPRIARWVPALREAVGEVDERTFLVGHSMGCQTIARFLEDLPSEKIAGGVIFVAGFFTELTGLEDDDLVRDVVKEWLTTPVDFDRVRAHTKKSVAVFSDNDQYVPLTNQERYKKDLDAEIIIEHGKGHFSGSQGVYELPIVLEKLIQLTPHS